MHPSGHIGRLSAPLGVVRFDPSKDAYVAADHRDGSARFLCESLSDLAAEPSHIGPRLCGGEHGLPYRMRDAGEEDLPHQAANLFPREAILTPSFRLKD